MTTPCSEKETLAVLKTHQEEIRENVRIVLDILQGNGKPGLKTQVEIHKRYFRLVAGLGGPVLVFLIARQVWAWIGS
jgi:hypothetical protein